MPSDASSQCYTEALRKAIAIYKDGVGARPSHREPRRANRRGGETAGDLHPPIPSPLSRRVPWAAVGTALGGVGGEDPSFPPPPPPHAGRKGAAEAAAGSRTGAHLPPLVTEQMQLHAHRRGSVRMERAEEKDDIHPSSLSRKICLLGIR